MLHSCIKGFLRAKKLWVNPPKAERAKPSLSSDYNLLFKNKIGERSLDIHRFAGDLGVNFDVTTWTTEVSSSSVIHVYGTKVQLGRQQANTRVCVAMRLNGEFIVTSGDGRLLVQDSVPVGNLQNCTRDQGPNPAAQTQQAQPRARHMSSAMADLDVLYQE